MKSYSSQPSNLRVSDKQLRLLTAVAAVSAMAMLFCGYRWWAEPVMTDEGYGLGFFSIGLTTLAVIAVASSWNAFALRVARRVGEGEVQRRPVLVGEAVAMGPLSVITLLLMVSNQTMAVWLFIFIGVPLLFVGFLIATTPPSPKSDTMGDDV